MKAKLKRQLAVLQEKEFRALSHTSACLCPLGQNTLSFKFPESSPLTPTAGPLHLPGMLFPLPPRVNASLSFTFQISHPFSREGFLPMQSQPLYYVTLLAPGIFPVSFSPKYSSIFMSMTVHLVTVSSSRQ